MIVSRDSDFQERSFVAGHPPQVVWLKIPNRSKTFVLNILLDHHTEIEQALIMQNRACVEINPSNRHKLRVFFAPTVSNEKRQDIEQ